MTALNPAGWRPEMTAAGGADDRATFTGNRALMLEEALIFEIGSTATTGVDFDEAAPAADLGALARTAPIGLPGLSEAETVRPLHAPVAAELRDRPRAVPARQLHDEA
jgi:glycine dehydrogenase subunit 2